MKRSGGSLLLVVAMGLGCVGDGGTAIGAKTPAQVTADGKTKVAAARIEDQVKPRPAGVPHSDNLVEVAIDDAGKAALTLDGLGGLRFWASLDGSVEPTLVRGSLANLDVRRSGTGWRAVGIDPAGSATALWLDKNGNATVLFSTPPSPQAVDALITADDRVAVLGQDHVLRILDGGKVVSTYQARSFRPTRIFIDQRGQLSLLAMQADKKETSIELRKLTAAGQTWTSKNFDVTVKIPSTELPSQVRLSPSGSKLALFSRKGLWQLHTIELATGKKVSSATGLARARIPGGGWRTDRQFAFVAGAEVRVVEVGASEHKTVTQMPGPAAHLLPTSIHQRGARLIAGAGDHLYVLDTDKPAWTYLGYGQTTEGYQRLSASGNKVAWRDQMGNTFVHDRKTGTTKPLLSVYGAATGLHFYGEDRLLAFYNPKRLVMFNITTGAIVDQLPGTLYNAKIRGNHLLLPNDGSLVKLSDAGFQGLTYIAGFAQKSHLVKGEGGWQLLALSRKDAKARMLSFARAKTITADQFNALPIAHQHIGTSSLVDDLGRPYKNMSRKAARLSETGAEAVYYELPATHSGTPQQPAPMGKFIAYSTSQNSRLYVYDGDSGNKLWGRTDISPGVQWTATAKRVLIANRNAGGFELIDSKTGRTEWKLCGHSFGPSPAPPTRRRSNHNRVPNVCSQ